MNILHYLLLLATLFILSGCAPKQAMIKVDHLISQGEYKKAAEFSDKNINKSDTYARNNLLWRLQSGSAYLYAGDDNKSLSSFNDNEALMSHYRKQILAQDIGQTLSSILLNDTTRPYIGTEYDGTMANTYKALNYMALGDTSSARVKFNRAVDRQRCAKIFFSEMIHKEQKAIHEEESKKG